MTVLVRPSDELFGRNRELQVMARWLDAAREASTVLLLEGDAGLGKTTLLRHGAMEARARGFCVLSARPGIADVRLSFATLTDLLEPVVDGTLVSLPSVQRVALERALLRGNGAAVADPRAVGLAVRGVIRKLSTEQPVLMVVDDLQWVDSSSGRVLEFVLRRLSAEQVGFLGAFRGAEGTGVPFDLDRALDDGVERHVLGPLSLGALYQLLRARLGLALPRPLLVRVLESSGGNPFFALEIGRALREGDHDSAGLPLPATIRELWQRRCGRLSPGAMATLLAVSALSEPTVTRVLAAAEDETQAAADLEEACRAGLIEFDGDRVAFAHPVLSAACYAGASPARRRQVHRVLAGIVESSEERARHLALAARGRDGAVAAALEQAATSARARGAPESAAELAVQAVMLTPQDSKDDAYRRRSLAAALHLEAGDPLRARATLEEMLDGLEGVQRAETLLSLGLITLHTDGIQAAFARYRCALEHVAASEILAARIHHALASGCYLALDIQTGQRHASAALAIAERCDDPGLLVECLTVSALMAGLAGRDKPAASLITRAVTIDIANQPLIAPEASPAVARALLLVWTDRLDEARLVLEHGLDAARTNHDPSASVYLSYLSLVQGRAGAWALAYAHADEAFALAELAGRESTKPLALHMKAQAAAHLGRVSEAMGTAEEVFSLAQKTGSRRLELVASGMLGFLHLSGGDAAAAVRYLEPAANSLHSLGVDEPGVFTFVPDAIEALIEVGALDRAAKLLELLEQQGKHLGRGWALMTAARCRGKLEAASGRPGAAEAALRQSLAHHDQLPAARPFDVGRTLLVLGATLRGLRRKRDAREALEEAIAYFDRTGAQLWVERARSELGRIGGRGRAVTDLSETERRVAELVASGCSNKQVAQTLVLSPKTVAWNLTRIYRKLGVRSRTELALRLASTADKR